MFAIHQTELSHSRKMWFFPVFLLFVASALATDSKNNYQQPIDYFDDDFQSNLKVGPDSTFSFNFEQIRRDQPPQIEMREENVGRYFRTRSQTTSTTPASIFSMKAEKESQHVYPVVISTNNYHNPQEERNEQHTSSVPSPPKFAFSKPHTDESNLQKNSAPTWNNPNVHQNTHPGDFHIQVPRVSIPSHPVQRTEPQKTKSTPYTSSHLKNVEGIRFAPSASYVSDSISNNVPRQPSSLRSRGSHKFSFDDIKKHDEIKPIANNQRPQISSTPQSIHNKPPPPVPTLSPWYDNFGK